ncbi:hypothetical protein ACTQZS_12885 [Bilifractor sp. LCP19S3_H10]|uniref:hypothetical protein n=1 Tax=Bilifractor sp. LCP19S3_H10 TaxID=3438736 RepID=UPI003F90A035
MTRLICQGLLSELFYAYRLSELFFAPEAAGERNPEEEEKNGHFIGIIRARRTIRISQNKRGVQKRDKTRCASFISLSRRSPHTNTSHSAAAHCSRK